MSWVRTEDTARLHPKFFRAGVAAWGWWNAALGYCNHHLSDGFIPSKDILMVFPGTPRQEVLKLLATLVAEGLVHMVNKGRRVQCGHKGCRSHKPVAEGYLLHDYSDYQPSRSKVIKRRFVRAMAGRQGGIKSGISRKQIASGLLRHGRSKNEPRPDPRNTRSFFANANYSNGDGTGSSRVGVVSSGHFADCDCPTCVKRRDALTAETEQKA